MCLLQNSLVNVNYKSHQVHQITDNKKVTIESRIRSAKLQHLFLGEYDKSEQLVLKSFHCHSEVDNGGLGADFRRVGWVAELGRNVQLERLHHVQLLVADLHLQRAARSNEVPLKDVVQRRVQLLSDVFYQQRSAQRQAVFQVSAEILVVEVSDLQ